ncbi:hypothetical protein DWY99_04155 [[Clostridium] leptum]|uniref:Uncharacterized protein n=1 Tax=[Clostridium] leptum TaxID=1535 RepID=A0A412AZD7_9FIRM|nr:hypothetical protein DWY99_04155 [[Clostridium] leptum]
MSFFKNKKDDSNRIFAIVWRADKFYKTYGRLRSKPGLCFWPALKRPGIGGILRLPDLPPEKKPTGKGFLLFPSAFSLEIHIRLSALLLRAVGAAVIMPNARADFKQKRAAFQPCLSHGNRTSGERF